MRAGRSYPIAALAVTLALGLAACGGSSPSSATTPTTTSSVPSGPSSTAQPAEPKAEGSGSKSFIVPGGDNSVQRYGAEAPQSEREAASRVAAAFMRARSEQDWSAECATLARSTLEPLEKLATSSGKLKSRAGCAGVLELIASHASGPPPDVMAGPVGSLRVKGDRAFALFHGKEGIDYVVPMQREGASWRVATLEPVKLS